MPWIFMLILVLFPPPVGAVTCKSFQQPADFTAFYERVKATNPLNLSRFSLLLELSPCESSECDQANRGQRLDKKEILHLYKNETSKRVNFLVGRNSPQCFLNLREKDYKCTRCTETRNENCRATKVEGSKTLLKGTNIDSADFDFLSDPSYQNQCNPWPQNPNYLLFTALGPATSLWSKVEIYLEKKREIPVLVRFFYQDRLTKVYRFYPQSYVQLQGHWYSTQFRVRGVEGDENRFFFETAVKVLANATGQLQLFLDPNQDPLLGAKEAREALFIP